MKYEFDLEPDFKKSEDYQDCNDNILEVQVFDKTTQKQLENCYVMFYLSKNGMLGFGENLIRFSQNFHIGSHVHLDPSVHKNLSAERLGVWTTPESTPVIVCCDNLGNVDETIISKLKE